MVQGQWLLLGWMACSPESLRIHVPKKGVESVQQEDLRRAVWAMQSTDPIEWFDRRAESLGLVQAELGKCYSQANSSNHHGHRLVLTDVNPVATAVMASLAKSLHRGDFAEDGWQFCLGAPTEPPAGWKDVSLTSWMQVADQPFTELHFVTLEQSVRQVVETHLVKP